MSVAMPKSRKAGQSSVPAPPVAVTAWEGIAVQAPEAWNIVATSGTSDEGYYRVDGSEGEVAEFRWRKVRSQPDLEDVARDYLKQVKKSGRKQKNIFEGDILGFRRRARSRKGQNLPTQVRFEWLSERQAFGKLLWCADCKRIIIAQVSFSAGRVDRNQAEAVLGSLHDHGADDKVEWGLYGLSFRTPPTVKLVRQQLMSGFLSMNFKGRTGRVIVERWGLAEELLRGGMLTWHDQEYLGTLASFRGRTTPVDWGEHEALQTEGYEGGLQRVRSLARAFFMPWRAERFASVAWHCPGTNRIVGVRAFGRKPLELARGVAASVRCHG